ncbi:hypothetical protein AXF42_Ash012582 [Apostasia shenzhenica]|uniref:Uncharacterized protein n=1 Tax=Apostasia shenzhenica TaxID=1088818 RepID=A0A2H9ZT25_9ASPA|nr:hypothetical protein AXF42_Ash012582 [Apostasia shenzhenica]
MRRSPGMGGGSILRAVGRAVSAEVGGVKEAVSATAGVKTLKPVSLVALSSSLSGAASSSSASAASTAVGKGSMHCFYEGEDWETVECEEEESKAEEVVERVGDSERLERFVFGEVPSKEEAEEAVSAIKEMFVLITMSGTEGSLPVEENENDKAMISAHKFSRSLSAESQSDWIEPPMHLYSSKACECQEREKVLDAFRLLQFNSSIQRIVVSLSSDTAVWDAVMKNEVVQEFKKSFFEDEIKAQDSSEGTDAPRGILKWIMEAKKKILELLDKIVNQIFQPHIPENVDYVFVNVLRSSFMLSVVVFMVIVMSRAQKS